MTAVRPISDITIWGRSAERAAVFAASLDRPATVAASVAQAVAEADIICTTTPAAAAILTGAALRPGTHVNLFGSAIPSTAEADTALVAMSEYHVDHRDAALAAAVELRAATAAGPDPEIDLNE